MTTTRKTALEPGMTPGYYIVCANGFDAWQRHALATEADEMRIILDREYPQCAPHVVEARFAEYDAGHAAATKDVFGRTFPPIR